MHRRLPRFAAALFVSFCFALDLSASAVAAEETGPVAISPPAAAGGEIRIVIMDSEPPPECISTGLVRFDSDGRLAPGLAASWIELPAAKSWRFFLKPGILDANGIPITETDVIASLKNSATRRLYHPRPTRLTAESGTILLRFPKRDRVLPRRLAHPDAGIRITNRESTGPYRIAARSQDRVMLTRNPYSIVEATPETVVLLFERDAGRAVFLVEAGYADAAPVGDEDLIRLASNGARLVPAASRNLHALTSGSLVAQTLQLLRRCIDRSLIVRTLLNGRGLTLGPDYRALSEFERRSLPRRILLIDESGSPAHARLVARIAYDLRRSGIACEPPISQGFIPTGSREARYIVTPEIDLPPGAVALYAVTPYWFVSDRISGFSSPRTGMPGWFSARAER